MIVRREKASAAIEWEKVCTYRHPTTKLPCQLGDKQAMMLRPLKRAFLTTSFGLRKGLLSSLEVCRIGQVGFSAELGRSLPTCFS